MWHTQMARTVCCGNLPNISLMTQNLLGTEGWGNYVCLSALVPSGNTPTLRPFQCNSPTHPRGSSPLVWTYTTKFNRFSQSSCSCCGTGNEIFLLPKTIKKEEICTVIFTKMHAKNTFGFLVILFIFEEFCLHITVRL